MSYQSMKRAVFFCAAISLFTGCSESEEVEARGEDASSADTDTDTDTDTEQPTADTSTQDAAAADDASSPDLSSADAVEDSSGSDAGCVPVRAYPVVEDADGNRCADLLGPSEELGCSDPESGILETTACYEDPVTGNAWVTNNVRDELLEQGFRRCESFGGDICD